MVMNADNMPIERKQSQCHILPPSCKRDLGGSAAREVVYTTTGGSPGLSERTKGGGWTTANHRALVQAVRYVAANNSNKSDEPSHGVSVRNARYYGRPHMRRPYAGQIGACPGTEVSSKTLR